MNVYDEKGFPRPNEDFLYASEDDMKWWKDARFGMFVHWGPASLCGGDISWCRQGYRPEDHQFVAEPMVPTEEYDALYKKFNPVNFNADEWIDTVVKAGMKYFVVITKHHDGFCLFDSRFTEHKSTAPDCPAGKDFIRELSDACHRKGVKFGIYYSGRDWYHEDYLKDGNTKYLEYYTSQLTELLTGYGRIDLLWFDHIGGEHSLWNPDMILRLARSLHPGIIINDRLHASVHHGRLPGYDGDFSSPEQQIGQFNNTRPWESCMCLVGGVWSYKPGGRMMTFDEVIRTLVYCAGGDGNLLLNSGPMPDGRIEPRQRELLTEVGGWLEKYGESIYGTRGGPVMPCENYACTRSDNRVYLHILNAGKYDIDVGENIVSAEPMNGNADITSDGTVIHIAAGSVNTDLIIKITVR